MAAQGEGQKQNGSNCRGCPPASLAMPAQPSHSDQPSHAAAHDPSESPSTKLARKNENPNHIAEPTRASAPSRTERSNPLAHAAGRRMICRNWMPPKSTQAASNASHLIMASGIALL